MRFHPAVLVSAVLGLSLFGAVFPQQRAAERPAQYSARGTHGAIAAGSGYATEAAMRMYYMGGNAVDAGVASIFAAATTEYSHVGWGGEAPILIRTKDGKVHAIAGVGTMPKLATADFYRKRPLELGEILERPLTMKIGGRQFRHGADARDSVYLAIFGANQNRRFPAPANVRIFGSRSGEDAGDTGIDGIPAGVIHPHGGFGGIATASGDGAVGAPRGILRRTLRLSLLGETDAPDGKPEDRCCDECGMESHGVLE